MRLLAWLFCVTLTVAHPVWSDPSPVPATAVWSVDDTYDFGARSVLDAAPIAHTFVLKAGAKAAVVDRLQPSCHCTQATPESGADQYGRFTIAAGQEARVAVTVNPSDLVPGAVEKEVYVFVNGESSAGVTLHIKGMITPPVVFSTPALEFGSVPAGTARTLPLTVTLDPRLLSPGQTARVVCSDPRVGVVPQGPAPWTAGPLRCQVTIPDGLRPGKFSATLFVALSGDDVSRSPQWSIPVRGEVAAQAAARQ